MAAGSSPAVSRETGYRVDDLVVDIGRRRITRADVALPLSQLSFELFLALIRAAPNLLSFDQLMERVWPGLVVSPETVSQRVKLVRDALTDDPHSPRYIAGVRGRGYRILAPVEPLGAERLQERPTSPPPELLAVPTQEPQNGTLETPRTRWSWRQAGLGAGIALLLASLWGLHTFVHHPTAGQPATESSVLVETPRTIAVLPLVDISPGGGNDYLGDGLAQELSNRLARIPGVRVASQTSAAAFKGRPVDVRAIARTLGVRHVLEGSVRRDGDHLRVTARLIDANSGHHVWSQTYDRDWKEMLAIEDDLSRSMVQVLQVVLSSDVAQRMGHPSTAQVQAFDLYLNGLAKLRQRPSQAQMRDAEAMFQESLRIDPQFAQGYAGLCEGYTAGYEQDRDTALAHKAEAACTRALALDSSLREVESALAHLYLASGRDAKAEVLYRNSIRKYPDDADAYIGLAEAYAGQQRLQEAEGAYRRAIAVEPDYSDSHTAFANFLLEHGRAAAAVDHYRRVTELVSSSPAAFSNLGAALIMTGELRAAAQAFEQSLRLEPTRSAYSNSGTVYYFLGRFDEATRMFRKAIELSSEDPRVWGNLADARYQIAAEREAALQDYRRAISLTEKGLQVNPTDAVGWIQLAFYHARLGDAVMADKLSAKALGMGPDEVYVHYYSALIAIQQQKTGAALASLRRAVELGYPTQLIRAAPEFVSLRKDERFDSALAAAPSAPTG
jgi:TolB-like protein/tetratricopeptide (TPR) repeat protein/DNA-binding winged helix-turn-helix (wHTH) protein